MTRKVKLLSALLSISLVPSLLYAATGHGGGHEGAHHVNWLYVAATITNFIIFVAILVHLLKEPVLKFFTERSDSVKEAVERREVAHTEARQRIHESVFRMEELERQWKTDMEKYRADGEAERLQIIEQARQQAEKIKEDALKIIDSEVRKARADLRREAAQEVVKAAEKILAEKLTDADRTKLIDEYTEMLR